MPTKPCRKCHEDFFYPKQRGRPPVECPECKSGVEKTLPAVITEGSDPFIGQKVTIKAREWHGIPLAEESGILVRWTKDKIGPIAVVELKDGSERMTRSTMLTFG